MEDKRFSHLKTDPKFRRIPKGARKVKIDKRFQSMFEDKKFKVKYTVDKRGRPVNHTTTEDLKRYYELSSEESASSEQEEETHEAGKFVKAPTASTDLTQKHKTDKALPDEVKKKLKDLKVDYARGEASLFSESSSDDEESEVEEAEEDNIEHKWGELDNDAEEATEATCRLAACNMDWDRIRTVDLMVLFNSFLPPGGVIKSVTIYPSEFGKQRMEEEEVKGPLELVESKAEEEEETEEGSKYHMEKLRQYQLNRLKYYYAVIVCDSVNTANKIYTECDGMEYESSATKIDLRFIPDDLTFDDQPKEHCDKLPELNKYQPRFFTTTALQQAKVDLTWDETDPERLELTQKLNTGKIEEISETDLQNFVAFSDEESEKEVEDHNEQMEEIDENPINKYKQLLQEIETKEEEKKNKDIEMEVSWGLDLQNKTKKLVNEKMKDTENKTPFEKYLEKRKEKRKERRKQKNEDDSDDMPSDIDMNDPYFAEEFNNPEFKKKSAKKERRESEDEEDDAQLELLLDEDENKSHFSLKKIQKQEEESTSKRKRKNKQKEEKKSDDFQINVDDDRFSALYSSHLYNIDPSDPHYKKTKGMETLISEKIKRRKESSKEVKAPEKKNAELSVLVKSIKRKTEALNKKK